MIQTKSTTTLSVRGLFAILILTLSLSACDLIIDSVGDEPLPDEVPGADNPNDPENPDFTISDLRLLNLPTTPFTSSNIEIQWEPVEAMDNLQYRYRIASPSQNISDIEYSDYQTETYVQLFNLVETFNGEVYNFDVEVSYIPDPQKNKTFSETFEVDALHGRGFLFRPRNIQANDDGTFTAFIFIDEIEPTDELTSFSLAINYNSNELEVREQDVRIYNDNTSFLYREGAEIISFHKIASNRITIEAGVAGNNLPPLSGGGGICEITFTPLSNFSSSSISISATSVLKNIEGFDIEISAFDEAVIQ